MAEAGDGTSGEIELHGGRPDAGDRGAFGLKLGEYLDPGEQDHAAFQSPPNVVEELLLGEPHLCSCDPDMRAGFAEQAVQMGFGFPHGGQEIRVAPFEDGVGERQEPPIGAVFHGSISLRHFAGVRAGPGEAAR